MSLDDVTLEVLLSSYDVAESLRIKTRIQSSIVLSEVRAVLYNSFGLKVSQVLHSRRSELFNSITKWTTKRRERRNREGIGCVAFVLGSGDSDMGPLNEAIVRLSMYFPNKPSLNLSLT